MESSTIKVSPKHTLVGVLVTQGWHLEKDVVEFMKDAEDDGSDHHFYKHPNYRNMYVVISENREDSQAVLFGLVAKLGDEWTLTSPMSDDLDDIIPAVKYIERTALYLNLSLDRGGWEMSGPQGVAAMESGLIPARWRFTHPDYPGYILVQTDDDGYFRAVYNELVHTRSKSGKTKRRPKVNTRLKMDGSDKNISHPATTFILSIWGLKNENDEYIDYNPEN